MNKEKFIIRYKGKETEMLRFIETSDGSKIMVLAPDKNSDGAHISIHPSGICNFRSNKDSKEGYDFLKSENQAIILKAVKDSIELIDLTKINYILVVDKSSAKGISQNKKEVYDLDKLMRNLEYFVFKKFKNLDFLKQYYSSRYEIIMTWKDGDWSCPIREMHGYHVNTKKVTDFLDKKFHIGQ